MLNENNLLKQLACRQELVFDILNTLPINIANKDKGTIRFDEYSHNSHAYTMDMNTLKYYNFRENKKGNIIDLVCKLTNKDKSKFLSELYMTILIKGLLNIEEMKDTPYENYEYTLEYPESYEESCIENYPKKISELFLEDNLWITTQEHWGIRYDYKYKRVVIPVYQDCELVGAIGRLNKKVLEKFENKYMPTLVYNKTRVLFGFDEYKEKIKDTKKVILVESEKSVMKAWQYRLGIPVLAVGSSSISRHHIERLNILGVDTVIWAQDKGVEEEDVLINNIVKLKNYSKAKNIFYLDVDSCNLLEDKECFLDKDIDTIKEVLKKYIKSGCDLIG